jgi:1-aminocyclopropane-1-carboxylate deaminase/D-cysteine desulfhydrase-like pyridoxal-dependent ACC family enzyme
MRNNAFPQLVGTLELLDTTVTAEPDDLLIAHGFQGAGYGIPTDAGIEAILLLAKTEAVFLDPVYTGKAMSALIAHVRAGYFTPEESIVFIHTGGTPSVFVHRDLLLQSM